MSFDLGTARGKIEIDSSGVSKGVGSASSSLSGFLRSTNSISSGVGRSFSAMGRVAGIAFAGMASGALLFGKNAVAAFTESNKVAAQTGAVLKSTGGSANVTASEITSLADKIRDYSGISDEAVQSGENMLLTFTNVRNEVGAGNDIFNQATTILADMSVALGTDMSTSAIQLGKALNDPIKGVTALSRVGVTFTQVQKDQIAALVEAGDVMGAQKIILAELTKEFGGSAKAMGEANPAGILKSQISDIQETIGGALIPVLNEFLAAVGPVLQNLADPLVKFIQQLGALFVPLIPLIGQVAGIFANVFAAALTAIIPLVQAILPVIADLAPAFEKIGLALADALVSLTPFIVAMINLLPPLLALAVPLINLAPQILAVVFALKGISALGKISGIISTMAQRMATLGGASATTAPAISGVGTAAGPAATKLGTFVSALKGLGLVAGIAVAIGVVTNVLKDLNQLHTMQTALADIGLTNEELLAVSESAINTSKIFGTHADTRFLADVQKAFQDLVDAGLPVQVAIQRIHDALGPATAAFGEFGLTVGEEVLRALVGLGKPIALTSHEVALLGHDFIALTDSTSAAIPATNAYYQLVKNAPGLTEKQIKSIAGLTDAIYLQGGSLTQLQQLQISNMLAAGDFSGAMSILRGVADQVSGSFNIATGNVATFGAAVAGAKGITDAQRESLSAVLIELDKNKISLTENATAAVLDALAHGKIKTALEILNGALDTNTPKVKDHSKKVSENALAAADAKVQHEGLAGAFGRSGDAAATASPKVKAMTKALADDGVTAADAKVHNEGLAGAFANSGGSASGATPKIKGAGGATKVAGDEAKTATPKVEGLSGSLKNVPAKTTANVSTVFSPVDSKARIEGMISAIARYQSKRVTITTVYTTIGTPGGQGGIQFGSQGLKNWPGGWALTGEKGKEFGIWGGQMHMLHNSMVDMPRGATVIPHWRSWGIARRMGIPGFASGLNLDSLKINRTIQVPGGRPSSVPGVGPSLKGLQIAGTLELVDTTQGVFRGVVIDEIRQQDAFKKSLGRMTGVRQPQ